MSSIQGMSYTNVKCSKLMLTYMKRQQTSTMRVQQSTNTKIDEYLLEPCVEGYTPDSLEWWRKIRCYKYPHLLVLAK